MIQPLVSVKMLTYNHAPFIARAIEGVLEQRTTFPVELLIGEDCSTDGTREIVFEYQKKNPDTIRIITSHKNVGTKKNSYRTTKACKGEYLAFCEGDDYWHDPQKLQKQVDYLNSHPRCGMLFADCNVYYNSSKILRKAVSYSAGRGSQMTLDVANIVRGILIPTCTVICRRHLVEQIVEDDPYLHQDDKFLMGDLQLWAELASRSEVVFIPECLATYRVLDESASNTRDCAKALRFRKSAHEIKLYLCNKYKLSDDIRNYVHSNWYHELLELAFLFRDKQLAVYTKKHKHNLSLIEWVLYYGAIDNIAYYACNNILKARNFVRRYLSIPPFTSM